MSQVTTNLTLKRRVRALLYGQHSALALLAPGMLIPGLALAGPEGGVVVGGEADIVRPNANGTVINQLTNRAAINWQTFNVDADEYVIFNQPGASSIVLNRVLGGDASYILGHMESNGQVFLLNPHGVYFTHGASLDVQGFLASTLDMNPNDFMAGDFTLTRSDNAPATGRVINDGQITAGPGGYVVLAGDYTENTGIITANAGSIALVSGNALTLDIKGDGLVSFAIDEASLSAAAGVRNAGSLIADGGRVIMTAKVANDLVATAVNNEGLVRAHSVEERGGEIYLVGHGGDVINSGTLDADGENANGGGIAMRSDRNVILADSGVQTAAGDANHKGGVIRAIAEEHLDYQRDNVIRVTGGNGGGFVEVSGHGSLNLRGIPQIGPGGTFMIDPGQLFLRDGIDGPGQSSGSISTNGSVGIGHLESQLNSGTNVILVASNEITYTGTGGSINVAAGSAELSMVIGSISTGASVCNFGVCLDGAPVITPYSGGTIDISGLDIQIQGNIKLHAQSGTIIAEDLMTATGHVHAIADAITIGGNISAAQYIQLDAAAAGNVTVAGAMAAGTSVNVAAYNGLSIGAVTATEIDLNGGFGGVTVNGNIAAVNAGGAASIDILASNGGIAINGNVLATGTGGGAYITVDGGGNGGITISGNMAAEGTDAYGSHAARVYVNSNPGGDVTITGGIKVTGNPDSYSFGGSYGGQQGTRGHAELYASANGSGDLAIGGPVIVTGTGKAKADLYGRNVTAGNISVTANAESFVNSANSSIGSDTLLETVTAGGAAEVHVSTGLVGGIGNIVLGDIVAKGPDAFVHIQNAQNVTVGALTLEAAGNNITRSGNDSNGAFTGTMLGGFAELYVGQSGGGATSTTIDINGAITVNAMGRAAVTLHGDSIQTRGIDITATAGEFSRDYAGSSSFGSDWPFDADFGGPKIDEGTVKGGEATLFVGGVSGLVPCDGICPPPPPPSADNVQIDGSINVKAPGLAEVTIIGGDIAVSGGINATATRAQASGTYADSNGSTATFGTVVSSIGTARVDLHSVTDEAVNVGGDITVSGPQAHFDAIGGTVTLGNLSVTGTGFELDVHEALEDTAGNPLGTFDFQGSHFVTGVGVEAVGAVKVGNVNIEGIGAAGIIFSGATITTGSINVRATAGEFTTNAPSFTGGAAATTPTGAAVIGFESPTAATVNGDITISGARTAHVGGRANASGDFTITGGRGVFTDIPAYVDFLDHIDDGDIGEDPLILAAAQIRAANITANVTNGNLSLGTAQLVTNGTFTAHASGNLSLAGHTQSAGSFALSAGNNMTLSNATLNTPGAFNATAGNNMLVSNISLTAATVALTAGGNITNSNPPGTITADAIAIKAGGIVDLSNTTLVVGTGRFDAIPGDTRLLELMAAQGLRAPGGGPNLFIEGRGVSLGNLSLAGDYVLLSTNSLAVNGTVSSGNPDMLLQVAPLGLGATFSLEGSSPSSADASYLYAGGLGAFDAGTIALGTTKHTGGVGVSVNSATLDIGDANLFVLTSGSVRGLGRVISTGIVKDLATLLSGGFDIPQTGEIDARQDVIQSLRDEFDTGRNRQGDEEEEGDEEGEDTDTDTDVEDDDDSLVRQDTVDEEMMCR